MNSPKRIITNSSSIASSDMELVCVAARRFSPEGIGCGIQGNNLCTFCCTVYVVYDKCIIILCDSLPSEWCSPCEEKLFKTVWQCRQPCRGVWGTCKVEIRIDDVKWQIWSTESFVLHRTDKLNCTLTEENYSSRLTKVSEFEVKISSAIYFSFVSSISGQYQCWQVLWIRTVYQCICCIDTPCCKLTEFIATQR